jgi:hypothetical protein
MASTKILLNGQPGRHIRHTHGLRHGDPLSSLLFMLVMEALNALVQCIKDRCLLTPLKTSAIRYCILLLCR